VRTRVITRIRVQFNAIINIIIYIFLIIDACDGQDVLNKFTTRTRFLS